MSGIGKRFLALGSGEILARVVSFAATIYLARTLSPALYGVVGVISGVMLYLNQLADAGVELAGMSVIAANRDQAPVLAGAILTRRLAGAVLLCALTIGVSLLFLPSPESAGFSIAALGLLATALSTRWVLLGLEQAGAVAISRTIGELIGAVVVVVLVRSASDLLWAPAALALSVAATSATSLVFLARQGRLPRWRWDRALTLPVLQRAKPLVGFTLLGLLLFNFDLIFLRVVTGTTAAGLYAAAYTFVALGANVIVAFAHTVLPTLVRAGDRPADRLATYQSAWLHAYVLSLPAGVGLALVAPQLLEFVFGTSYAAGGTALRFLALTIPLAAIRELPVIALLATGQEHRLIRINAITAAANIALVVAIVPWFGLVGAAAATAATEFLRLYIATSYATSTGMLHPQLRRLWRPTVSALAMAGVLVALPSLPLWMGVGVGGLVFAGVFTAVGGVRFRGRIPELGV